MSAPLAAGSIPLRERRTLAEEWKRFNDELIPREAEKNQRIEMRRAFYTGAATMLHLVTDLDPHAEPTDLDVAYLESLNEELAAFSRIIGTEKE